MQKGTTILMWLLILTSCGTVRTPQECNQFFVNSNYFCDRFCTMDQCKETCKSSAISERDRCVSGERVVILAQMLPAESAPGMAMSVVTGVLLPVSVGYTQHITTFNLELPSSGPAKNK